MSTAICLRLARCMREQALAKLLQPWWLAYCRLNGVRASRLRLNGRPIIRCAMGAHLMVGDDCTIVSRLRGNLAGITHPTVLRVGAGAVLRIGSHVGISGAIVYASTSITIGDWTQLGAGCCIYDTDFHPVDWLARQVHDVSQIGSSSVQLGSHVWIGAQATVLKGVTIGDRAIVAARSVVTRDVPPDCIAAGIPARVVRRLSCSSTEEV